MRAIHLIVGQATRAATATGRAGYPPHKNLVGGINRLFFNLKASSPVPLFGLSSIQNLKSKILASVDYA